MPVIVGGIIPPEDEKLLLPKAWRAVYTPKDYELNAIMADIVRVVRRAPPRLDSAPRLKASGRFAKTVGGFFLIRRELFMSADACTQGLDTGFIELGPPRSRRSASSRAFPSFCPFRPPPTCALFRPCWAGAIRVRPFPPPCRWPRSPPSSPIFGATYADCVFGSYQRNHARAISGTGSSVSPPGFCWRHSRSGRFRHMLMSKFERLRFTDA